jgi:hypothetical protein
MSEIRATPQNAALGYIADLLKGASSPKRTQQLQSIAEFFGLPGAAREVENWSYGNYPMQINPNAGRTASYIPEVKPGRKQDLADTLFLGMDAVVPLASVARRGAAAAARTPMAQAVDRAVREGYERGTIPAPGMVIKPKGGKAANESNRVSPHVEEMVRAVSKPEARKFSDEEVKALQEASIISRRKVPNELVDEGDVLKTVFDTNKTGAKSASVTKRNRSVREPELFAGKSGQTYGALLQDPQAVVPGNFLSSYGDYGLEFKPTIKSRTTISIGDLSDYGGFPNTATLPFLINNKEFPALRELAQRYVEMNPKLKKSKRMSDPNALNKFNKDDQAFWDWAGLTPIENEYGRPFAGASKIPRELTDLQKMPLLPKEQLLLEKDPVISILQQITRDPKSRKDFYGTDFIEAQIHGPVTPEDIARVYDYSGKPSSRIEKQFRNLGIDYVPVDKKNYAAGGLVQGYAEGGKNKDESPYDDLEPTFGSKAGAYVSDKTTEGLLWLYDKLADRDKLSSAHKILLDTFVHDKRDPLTAKDFNERDLAELQNLIKQKEKLTGNKGAGSIQYKEYSTLPDGDQTRSRSTSLVGGDLAPRPSLSNSLGQFNYKLDPKTGRYTIIDEYDFNPQRVEHQGKKYNVPLEHYGDYMVDAMSSPTNALYSLVRLYAGRKMPPGKGRKVDLSVPKYAAGGLVDFDPDEIAQIAELATQGFAAGGLVDYDPNEIDTIVFKMKEAFHG